MNDHIAKPVDPEKLSTALEQWLPERFLQSTTQLVEEPSSQLSSSQIDDTDLPSAISEEPVFDFNDMGARLAGDEELMREVIERRRRMRERLAPASAGTTGEGEADG